MTQPEALRLADRLSGHGGLTFAEMHAAAAELRRLHAQREALLKALRDIEEFSLEQPTKAVARAAIATVEGEKT